MVAPFQNCLLLLSLLLLYNYHHKKEIIKGKLTFAFHLENIFHILELNLVCHQEMESQSVITHSTMQSNFNLWKVIS